MECEALDNSVDLGPPVTLPVGPVGVGESDEVADRFGARPSEQPECYVADHLLAERYLHGNLGSYGPVSSFYGDLSAVLFRSVKILLKL